MNEYWEGCSVSFFVDVGLPYFTRSLERYTAGFSLFSQNNSCRPYPDTTVITFYDWLTAFEEADFEQWRANLTDLAKRLLDDDAALTIYKQHLVQMGYADPLLAFEMVELETSRLRVTVTCQQYYMLGRFVEVLGAICTDHDSAKETVLKGLYAALPAGKQLDNLIWVHLGVQKAPGGTAVPAQLGSGNTAPAGGVVPAQLGPGDTEPAGGVVPAQLGPGDTEPAGDVVPEIAKRKSKRGRSRYSDHDRKQAIAEWDSIDHKVDTTMLEDWLEKKFGATGGQLNVPKSTFHSWRKL